MQKYILVRLFNIVATLFVISTLTFFLMKQLPGSPFDEEKLAALPDEVRTQIYDQYGLNAPVWHQYVNYLGNLLKGDMGLSFYYQDRPVSNIIVDRIGPSALLGIQALIIGTAVGLILGLIAAFKHNSMWDYITMLIAVLGISIPNFVFAALLQYFVGLKWGVLPIAYWESYQSTILPTIALAIGVVAVVARFTRNEMLEVLGQDYIMTAKAKGLSSRNIIIHHAVRNAMIPVLTVLGPVVVSLITGSLVIEQVFSIPGIGSLFVESIKVNDYSMIMGVTLLFSVLFVFMVLIIDLLYGLIDPRIRLAGGKEG
ncbi:oligopeptide transport system permease protein [Pullulanibacillus pueri]|uniref:Peptide ABC transporter permease n=1 Tax=Pullulanibacillus pueri TaxID=1437324 RepID=A0A8J2ZWY9_9BACL|nr:ABC transporter permease [Pullulanibacillus pueri]MBM7682859.1 oligopeptide transport system permease protein [Pullulanibacillus pueri]GGH84311.1 peptide ABC transporter permease [Pullulanibacillus pueri]